MAISNELFRFISLRRPLNGLTIDPSANLPEVPVSVVMDQLAALKVDPRAPSGNVLNTVKDIEVLTKAQVDESKLYRLILSKIESIDHITFEELNKIAVELGGVKFKLKDVFNTRAFREDYVKMFDAWLKYKLIDDEKDLVETIERYFRVSQIIVYLAKDPGALSEAGIFRRLEKATILYPEKWRKQEVEGQVQFARNVINRNSKIKKAKKEFIQLDNRIELRYSIRSKSQSVFWSWLETKLKDRDNNARERGGDVKDHRIRLYSEISLDENFYAKLSENLNDEENREVSFTFGDSKPQYIGDFEAKLAPGDLVQSANAFCREIRIWEDEITATLPDSQNLPNERIPLITSIGFGDLIVAKETLDGYKANEIAHVENVMAGELKEREHERTRTTEHYSEYETIEESETENELETTDRYELQRESDKIIDTEYSMTSAINGTSSYGLSSIEFGLVTDFFKSKSEAQSSSLNLAKEVISKSVKRVFESTRQMKSVSITDKIRELNKHTLNNDTGEPRIGVYKWLEKVHKVELRQYGKRMMIELNIPEPALSLLETEDPFARVRKPLPFSLGPDEITESNYLCLTKRYGALEVEPPPAQFIDVGYVYKSAPQEEADHKAELTGGELISIPEGYNPISYFGRITVPKLRLVGEDTGDHELSLLDLYLFLIIGGEDSDNINTGRIDKENVWTWFTQGQFTNNYSWPQGVPVSLLAKGAYDNTLVAHLKIKCERSPENVANWKLNTWEKLKEAHQIQLQEYENAIREIKYEQSIRLEIQGGSSLENREIERNELKKWAIKIMRSPLEYEFDAVHEPVEDFQEVHPPSAVSEAPIIAFFEGAFEWDQMTYFMYPYFWGRRDSWRMRQNIHGGNDPIHSSFMKAGYAKVVLPIMPGYEEQVLSYILSEGTDDIERLSSNSDLSASQFAELWQELVLDKHEDATLGRGTLSVTNGSTEVQINDLEDAGMAEEDAESDVELNWFIDDIDIGRELFIEGYQYTIVSINKADNKFTLDEPYKRETNPTASYMAGSVSYSKPWTINLPTSLVVLDRSGEIM